jgi:hypothetical protein
MIVKSYKSRSEQSRAIYIIIGQFFQAYKSAVLKSNTLVLEKGRRNKIKIR